MFSYAFDFVLGIIILLCRIALRVLIITFQGFLLFPFLVLLFGPLGVVIVVAIYAYYIWDDLSGNLELWQRRANYDAMITRDPSKAGY